MHDPKEPLVIRKEEGTFSEHTKVAPLGQIVRKPNGTLGASDSLNLTYGKTRTFQVFEY